MDPAEPEHPGPPGDDAPGPARDEAPGPLQSEAPGPAQGEAPGPLPGDTPGPRPDEAADPSQGKALGPLQYGDASSPLHKAPHEEPSQEPEEPSQKQPIGTIPPATNADADADATIASATRPAGKRSRKKKILAWTSAALAAVVVIGALGAYFVYRHLDANLHQVDISGVLGSQPVDLHPQAENVLVLGSDTGRARAGDSAAARCS